MQMGVELLRWEFGTEVQGFNALSELSRYQQGQAARKDSIGKYYLSIRGKHSDFKS